MMLSISVVLFALFVIVSEQNNSSLINPYAVGAIFSLGYFYVSLILFQYSDFKRRNSKKYYLIEFIAIILAMHLYGSRLIFDSISSASLTIMAANILFSALFLKQISSDCNSVPNIKPFSLGAFGEYPVKTEKSLDKVKPLFWFITAIPFLSYFIWR